MHSFVYLKCKAYNGLQPPLSELRSGLIYVVGETGRRGGEGCPGALRRTNELYLFATVKQ